MVILCPRTIHVSIIYHHIDIVIYRQLPVRYDPGESRQHGFQQEAKIQEDQHMHAKAQNSNISSPLQNFPDTLCYLAS